MLPISPKEIYRLSSILVDVLAEYKTGTDDYALGYRLGSTEAFKDSIAQNKTPAPKIYTDSTLTARGYVFGWIDFKNAANLIECD